MGREVRMVPPDWEHPKNERGSYQPLFEDFQFRVTNWDKEKAAWDRGDCPDYADEEDRKMPFAEWHGERPNIEDYMPAFPEGTATHCQMYETVTEGTPISPVFATPEELAHWLAENESSIFGRPVSYEAWLRVAQGGFAPTLISKGGEMVSGVEGLSK